VVDRSFPKLEESPKPDPLGDKRLEDIFAALRANHPAAPDESAAYSKSLDQLDGVVETRARLVNASGETVPWPLVFILDIMGLAVLIVSLNFPFSGILPISDAPLRNFLEFRVAR
jgi:hypothetical protein